MPRIIEADLHVHTCLSPCADLLLSPRAVVQAAVRVGIGLVAVCDHNSAENTAAAVRAARGTGVTIVPGLEITTAEEVHILTLFADGGGAGRMQNLVYRHLQPGKNDERLFGQQIVVNEHDEVEGFNDRLLIGATSLPIQDVVRAVHDLGGLAIASHVDRETFGLIGHLGMIPEGLDLDAVEISRQMDPPTARAAFPGIERFPIVRSSDAHQPDEIGRTTTRLAIESPTFDELRLALRCEQGRGIVET